VWTPYLTNQWSEFNPILVTGVFGFVVLLTSVWNPIKGQGHSTQWPQKWVNTISSQIFEPISPKLGNVCTLACDILNRSKGQGNGRRRHRRRRKPVEFHLVSFPFHQAARHSRRRTKVLLRFFFYLLLFSSATVRAR